MLRFERDMYIHKYNLYELQNHSVNQDQDHLSICAFFQEEEQFQIHASKLKDRIFRQRNEEAEPYEDEDYYV